MSNLAQSPLQSDLDIAPLLLPAKVLRNDSEALAAAHELAQDARLQAGLKKQAVPHDPLAEKMVALKRKLVGNRNAFIDFFPTPESHAADLVALAGIEPG